VFCEKRAESVEKKRVMIFVSAKECARMRNSSSPGDNSLIGFKEAEHESDSTLRSGLIYGWPDVGSA
jgi:hypothetical protein